MKHPGHLVPFLILFFLPTLSTAGPATQAPLKTYLVTPSQGRPGKDYDLLITGESPDCQSQHELANAKLVAPEGSPLSVLETTTRTDCNITAKIRIPVDAGI